MLEYAAVVWAPHTKRDIDLIERMQLDLWPATTVVMLVSHKCSQILIGLHLYDAEIWTESHNDVQNNQLTC